VVANRSIKSEMLIMESTRKIMVRYRRGEGIAVNKR
jgi:hypothetical protein